MLSLSLSPPQSYSSTSSMRSRRSTADSASGGATSSSSNGSSKIVQDFASIVKFVHSKPFSDDLFHTPQTSARTALRRYIEAAGRSKRRRRHARAGKLDPELGGVGGAGSAAADGDSSMAATASSSVDGGGGGGVANGGASSSSDGASGHKASFASSAGSSDCFDVSLSKFEIGLCDALNIQQARARAIKLLLNWKYYRMEYSRETVKGAEQN